MKTTNALKTIVFLLLTVVIITQWPHLFQLGEWVSEQAFTKSDFDPVSTVIFLAMVFWLVLWAWQDDFSWFDEQFSKRDEFGLTDRQRNEILNLAKRSQTWRDAAEELACHAYGLKTSQFYLLLHRNGISTK